METVAIDNRVKQVVSNIRNLPTPPIVFHQIQKVINDPNVSAAHVASILSEDPAMSVKVLKLTNSAFYGLAREVDSVKQAVVIVGMEAIKNLVLSASVLDMFKGKQIDQEYQEMHWRHSLAAAFSCRLLARNLKAKGIVDPDLAFSAGLLHDIGKVVISCFLEDEYKRLHEARLTDTTSADFELEQQVLGYTHAQIGAYLAIHWKLPEKLDDAIAFHHDPQLCEALDATPYITHLGDYLARQTFEEADAPETPVALGEGVLDYMQIDAEKLESFKDSLREEYLKAETFMQMAGIAG
jgi:putative nucleotidyltransferase with HDIG domain